MTKFKNFYKPRNTEVCMISTEVCMYIYIYIYYIYTSTLASSPNESNVHDRKVKSVPVLYNIPCPTASNMVYET